MHCITGPRGFLLLVLHFALVGAANVAFGDEPAEGLPAERAALARFQHVVGEWKGVGQVRRGSNAGAWIEQSQWAWKFAPDRAALAFEADNAKYLLRGELVSSGEQRFALHATAQQGERSTPLVYEGTSDDSGRLVLTTLDAPADLPARITLRLVADGDRLVVLYERKALGESYARLAEVGYTRKGSGFGKGTSFVECVVTGGLGTIPVTFEGKTYYVCCTGCRDYFNEDPAGVLADYQARKAEEKAKRQAAEGE